MADIARAAGISAISVSRALRNDPRQGVKTCRKIQALAKKMGYRPNPMITALNWERQRGYQKHRPTIAIFGNHNSYLSPFSTPVRLIQGIGDRAQEFGFSIDKFSFQDPVPEKRWEEICKARNTAGLIFMPMLQDQEQIRMDLSSFACATIAYSLEKPALHRASSHHYQGMNLALDRLRQQGFRRIGYVEDCLFRERVLRLWSAAYLTHDLDVHLPIFKTESGAFNTRDFRVWLRRYKPDAIVALYKSVASLIDAVGLRIPKDVVFAGLDLAPSDAIQVGIDQQSEQVGAATFDLVMAQLHRNERGVPAIPKTVLIPPRWIDDGLSLAPENARK